MNKQNQAETDTARSVSAEMIAEEFVSARDHQEWEQASKMLCDLADNIVTPESLRAFGDLLHEIASEAERLNPDDEHEAETTEQMCNAICVKLGAKYSKFIGRG